MGKLNQIQLVYYLPISEIHKAEKKDSKRILCLRSYKRKLTNWPVSLLMQKRDSKELWCPVTPSWQTDRTSKLLSSLPSHKRCSRHFWVLKKKKKNPPLFARSTLLRIVQMVKEEHNISLSFSKTE